METDKTLRYPFGETPEEVIRETQIDGLRHRDYIAGVIDGLTVEQIDQYENWAHGRAPLDFDYDQLLTVLDALMLASNYAVTGGDQAVGMMQLRISILAALGIDEGGE